MRPAAAARREPSRWVAAYVVALLWPLPMLAVVPKPGNASFGTIFAAGLGFVALSALVLQVVGVSRLRGFTATIGVGLLLRLHRHMGTGALAVAAAHVVVLVLDDFDRLALFDLAHAPARARAGVVALVALLILFATSRWRQRFALPYEWWRLLHATLGSAALVGAFAHVMLVDSYSSAPIIRWTAAATVTAAIVALFHLRVGRRFRPPGRRYRLACRTAEAGGATTFELTPVGHPGIRFAPGQFAWLRLAKHPYTLEEHPFSFASSACRPERLEFTVKSLGDFTSGLATLPPGTHLIVDGPHGGCSPSLGRGYVLVVGGVGITPALSIIRTLADHGDPEPVLLVYGSRRWEDITCRTALERLTDRVRLTIVHVLSEPHPAWSGERGFIDEAVLRRHLPSDLAQRRVIVCGPEPMQQSAEAALRSLGVPEHHLHVERYRMA